MTMKTKKMLLTKTTMTTSLISKMAGMTTEVTMMLVLTTALLTKECMTKLSITRRIKECMTTLLITRRRIMTAMMMPIQPEMRVC